MPKKKRLDDYIKQPEKKHENQEFIKDTTFVVLKELSKKEMPKYKSTHSEKPRSAEEE